MFRADRQPKDGDLVSDVDREALIDGFGNHLAASVREALAVGAYGEVLDDLLARAAR